MSKYKIFNGPAPTTAAQASVASGTSVKTMLQLMAPAASGIIITGWGFSLDTVQAAAGTMELLKTDVAATVTASVIGDIVAIATPSAATAVQLGTAKTGYTASAEGSITNTDVMDALKLTVSTTGMPVAPYVQNFPKDQRPFLPAGKILRVRATTGTTSGLLCWITWIE